MSANQVLNGGKWNLPWLAGAIVLAVFAEGLNLRLETRDSAHGRDTAAGPVLWPKLAAQDGMPLLLGDVHPRDLGVHASRFGAEGNSPYIRRQADDLLAAALAGDEKRLIIVEGPRLAGATRTLTEAVQAHLPDHLAAGFIDDPRIPLADMIAQAAQWVTDAQEAAGAVLWLDGLSPDRFTELARFPLDNLPSGMLVLATLDTSELEGLRIPEQVSTLSSQQHAIRIELGTITEQERRDLLAEGTYALIRPMLKENQDLFLGRLMVAWEPLRAALTRGRSEQATDRVALLHAVTDWYRLQLPRLLNRDILERMYRAYYRELHGVAPDSAVSAAGFSDALQWATAAHSADRPRLIDLQAVANGQWYAPHPLLAVIADDPSEDISWSVSDVLWSYADHYFRGDQRRDIGYTALARSAYQAAARLLSHTDTVVDPAAFNQLALLFYVNAEWASGRHWYQRAIATGNAEAAAPAMFNLGRLEQEQGDPAQARHWYQQAIATRHIGLVPLAMVNLGHLEQEQGDPAQARHWYQQVIAIGDAAVAPQAMASLGVLEQEQGDLAQARHWYQQVIATGNTDHAPTAMFNLGRLQQELGHPAKARHWYQQAIATSHAEAAPMAMVNLARLEERRGDAAKAQHWYKQAIATGNAEAAPSAMFNLGVTEQELGDLDKARHWYQQAIATGHAEMAPRAMINLGHLEQKQGDLAQAQHWYKQAIATGHAEAAPIAMGSLGVTEQELGDLAQAQHWSQRAIATGHAEAAPIAMVNLARLEERRGGLAQARHWYQRAIATGHTAMATRAQQELRALNLHEKDRRRGEHFGRYGYLAYADPALMTQDNQTRGTE